MGLGRQPEDGPRGEGLSEGMVEVSHGEAEGTDALAMQVEVVAGGVLGACLEDQHVHALLP